MQRGWQLHGVVRTRAAVAAQHSTAQRSTACSEQHSTFGPAQHLQTSTACSHQHALMHLAAKHGIASHGTARQGIAQHGIAQQSTTQHTVQLAAAASSGSGQSSTITQSTQHSTNASKTPATNALAIIPCWRRMSPSMSMTQHTSMTQHSVVCHTPRHATADMSTSGQGDTPTQRAQHEHDKAQHGL